MGSKTSFSWDRYHLTPIVGIIRGMDHDTIRQIARVYMEAGLYTLEVTMNTSGAEKIIADLREEFPELNVGAGTVCNLDDLQRALIAGAQFIVTPIMDEEVIKLSVQQQIPIFPGAYTPTEIYRAWHLGASAVKLFPATQLGVQFIKDVSAPLDNIKLLPTGGVSLDNIRSFFEAGATGVGMGSSLFVKHLIESGDLESLKGHFMAIKSEIPELVQ
ncbi:bifunctional 4-hydroxy-2-oxoglutarate aldolase/2-dehydro-3-deoxy-phosphogluconate aldolase [Echinicola sediminis]